jgi:hypothetical protein
VLCASITLVYIAMPTFFFIKSGLQWTALSDLRLKQMNSTPKDIAEILWFITAYLAAFCAAYSLLRGPGMPGPSVEINIDPPAGLTLLLILAIAKS